MPIDAAVFDELKEDFGLCCSGWFLCRELHNGESALQVGHRFSCIATEIVFVVSAKSLPLGLG